MYMVIIGIIIAIIIVVIAAYYFKGGKLSLNLNIFAPVISEKTKKLIKDGLITEMSDGFFVINGYSINSNDTMNPAELMVHIPDMEVLFKENMFDPNGYFLPKWDQYFRELMARDSSIVAVGVGGFFIKFAKGNIKTLVKDERSKVYVYKSNIKYLEDLTF